jgi:ankyrin repeat protein
MAAPLRRLAPIFEAVSDGDAGRVRLLLAEGARADASEQGMTLLMAAVHAGCADVLPILVDAGADVHAKSLHGLTALMVAAWSGHVACIDALIGLGANVNDKNVHDSTALMCAADRMHADCVNALLLAGADVHVIDDEDRTALKAVVDVDFHPHDVYAELTGWGWEFPEEAADDAEGARCMQLLLARQADVNSTHKQSRFSVLILAARRRMPECTRVLIAHGADIHTSRLGLTPLFAAVESGSRECVRAVLEAGADVDALNPDSGFTALMFAANSRDELTASNTIETLLAGGASLDILDRYGRTAEMIARVRGAVHCLEKLTQPFRAATPSL